MDIYLEPVLPRAAAGGVRRLAGRAGAGAARQGDGLRGRRRRSRRRAGPTSPTPTACSPTLPPGAAPLARPRRDRSPSWPRWASATRRRSAAALALAPAYLGVVASRKRFAQMRELAGRRAGVRPRRSTRVTSPAGPRHRRAAAGGDRAQRPGGDRRSCARGRGEAAAAAPRPARGRAPPSEAPSTRLRHDGGDRGRPPHRRARGAHLVLLLRRLPRAVPRRARAVPGGRARRARP